MTGMRNTFEVSTLLEAYDIEGATEIDSQVVAIPDTEYTRLLNSVKNPTYIKNLRRTTPHHQRLGLN